MAPVYRLSLFVKHTSSDGDLHVMVTHLDSPFYEVDTGGPSNSGFIWDLPVSSLQNENKILQVSLVENRQQETIEYVEKTLADMNWKGLAIPEAIQTILGNISIRDLISHQWQFWREHTEPPFGPGPPIHTAIFTTEVLRDLEFDKGSYEDIQWIEAVATRESLQKCSLTLGPLATKMLSPVSSGLIPRLAESCGGQEYPLGVLIVPMASRTLHPFKCTNLLVIASEDCLHEPSQASRPTDGVQAAAAHGAALITDPGAHSGSPQAQLASILHALPSQLLIFLTHHHHDHIEGLNVVQKIRPNAVLIGHAATLARLARVGTRLARTAVEGGEVLLVGDQELNVVAAPGHTDGHLALFHKASRTLVAGDHCVGQGSAVLDAESGGDMQDYMESTRRLAAMNAQVLVPMHGRPCLWPRALLASYIRHREEREARILAAIEGGARSALQIVGTAYVDSPRRFWPAALHNCILHVRRLHQAGSLPQDFELEYFNQSCGWPFHLKTIDIIVPYLLYRLFGGASGYLRSNKTMLASLAITALATFVMLRVQTMSLGT